MDGGQHASQRVSQPASGSRIQTGRMSAGLNVTYLASGPGRHTRDRPWPLSKVESLCAPVIVIVLFSLSPLLFCFFCLHFCHCSSSFFSAQKGKKLVKVCNAQRGAAVQQAD